MKISLKNPYPPLLVEIWRSSCLLLTLLYIEVIILTAICFFIVYSVVMNDCPHEKNIHCGNGEVP